MSAGPQHTVIEQRRSRRYRQALRVELVDKRGARSGTAVDVARHGLFVAIVDPPHNRHLVQLTLHLPDGPLQAAATVARVLPEGVGLSLFALSADAKRRWDTYIAGAQQHDQSDPRRALTSLPTSAPPSSSSPSSSASSSPVPSPLSLHLPSFLVRFKTVDRLREYLQQHVAVGGTVLYTPVLPPQGSWVQLVIVHPRTRAEYALFGVIHRAVATPPKRLELLFSGVDLEGFARFIDDGRPPSTPPAPVAKVSVTSTHAGPERAHEPEFEPEFELEIDVDDSDTVMQEEPVKWALSCELDAVGVPEVGTSRRSGGPDDELTDPRRAARLMSSTAAFVIDVADDGIDDGTADSTADSIDDDELLIDSTVVAVDPGLRPLSLRLFCEDKACIGEPYVIQLGPCGGVLGLVADQVPFWSAASARVVTVPRLVAAATRQARFTRYAASGGSIEAVVTLATFLAAADLAEAPRHPVTAEPLRSSRAIDRLASSVRHAVAGEPAPTKVRCPACGSHLVLERV